MKKKKYLLSLLAVISSISCSGGNETLPEPTEPVLIGNGKALIIYFPIFLAQEKQSLGNEKVIKK
ncbi:MAG: hypothetical protein LBU22_13600 [Dysgonamonadaceae bacterium]|nr:hypothetical protein [Dysgonamonadaceae bacterium]